MSVNIILVIWLQECVEDGVLGESGYDISFIESFGSSGFPP